MQNKPRLLLINPWIYDFTAFDLWSKPMGLLYIAAYLRKSGYQIDFIDCMDKYHPELLQRQKRPYPKLKKFGTGPFHREIVNKPEILNFIPRHYSRYGMPEDIFIRSLQRLSKPDAILLTSHMTYWYPGPRRAAELVRELFPGVPLILGGIYATLMPDHARRIIAPNYLIEGPGELQIAWLLSEILPEATQSIEPLAALDDFPAPAFDLYSHLDYLVIMTSRGCPYHCTFCATDKISGTFAQRKPDYVTEEILQYTHRFHVRDVAFYDDALLINKKRRLFPILESLNKVRTNFRFHTPNGLHAREIDEETAQLFFRSGFTTIRLSFESVSPDRLEDMKNKVTPNDLETAAENLERVGYRRKMLEAYVLMGLPDQPVEEIYQSILFVHSLGMKVRLASFSPIPGTIDFDRAVNRGLFPADADPLLMNKTIYPLYRTTAFYRKFHSIRQFTNVLNQGIEREVNMLGQSELRSAWQKMIARMDS
ncbi:MAG: radical SAM protein [Calditrichia bacterium]